MLKHRNGTTRDRQQSRLTHEDALTIWRARDAYWVQSLLSALVILVLVIDVAGLLVTLPWPKALLMGGLHACVLWGLCWVLRRLLSGRRWGIAWLITRAQLGVRTWWHGLVLLVLLGGVLQGCVDAYRATARIYGCDPVAIERGYCTMPKEAAKP
jgi:hypothetical protein